MIEVLDNYDAGTTNLSKLSSDLKGLMGASDLHDESLIDDFWNYFARIDMELELRTESWAPPDSASDEALRDALDRYRAWVQHVLETTNGERT